jgi:hypothetical protein
LGRADAVAVAPKTRTARASITVLDNCAFMSAEISTSGAPASAEPTASTSRRPLFCCPSQPGTYFRHRHSQSTAVSTVSQPGRQLLGATLNWF